MQIPLWRRLSLVRNFLVPTFSASNALVAKSMEPSALKILFPALHSTPAACQKREKVSNSGVERRQGSIKMKIKHVVRQKRADTKKALKYLLYNSGCPKASLHDEDPLWRFDRRNHWERISLDKKLRSELSANRAGKSNHKKMKRRVRREKSDEEFDNFGSIFEATFGKRCHAWTSRRESAFQTSSTGFEWEENPYWTNFRSEECKTPSETDSEDDSCVTGSLSDRRMLGLRLRGPLKIEDVKNAFRLSALKWHPDKHHGSSQGMAEEKFKQCVEAYKSLCAALS